MKRSLLLLLVSAFIGSVATAQSTLLPPTNLTVSNVTDSSFVAKWSPSAGASYYTMDLSTSSNFSTGNIFIGQGTPFTSDTTIHLVAGTTYYFRVRAVNGSNSSANSVIRSLVLVPPAPLLWGVSTGGETEVVLNWSISRGATGYRVDVAINTNFDSLVYSNLDARNRTALSITNLKRGRLYSFRVRAVNSYGISHNSNVTSFRTSVPPVTSLAATNVTAQGFTANWSFPLHGPTVHYVFWAIKDSVYVFNKEVVGVTSVNVPVTSGGTYRYALYAYIIGDWGQTGISNETKVNVPFPTPSKNLRVYPNPLRSSEFLNVELEKLAPDANVIVSITSLAGGSSVQYEFKTGQDGTLRGRFPASSLKPGAYILNVNGLSYRFVVE